MLNRYLTLLSIPVVAAMLLLLERQKKCHNIISISLWCKKGVQNLFFLQFLMMLTPLNRWLLIHIPSADHLLFTEFCETEVLHFHTINFNQRLQLQTTNTEYYMLICQQWKCIKESHRRFLWPTEKQCLMHHLTAC